REVVGVVQGLQRVSGCKEATTHRVVTVIVGSEHLVRHLMVDGGSVHHWVQREELIIELDSYATTHMRDGSVRTLLPIAAIQRKRVSNDAGILERQLLAHRV